MLEQTPLITVYMPVYNADKYLKESIDSILRQTYTNFEFIIINDGSTDNSAAILDLYAKHDSRIKVLHQANQGVVKAANKAIEIAKGQYIARADADDISFDHKLEDLVRCAQQNLNAVVICGNIEVINSRSEFLYRDLVLPYSEDLKRAFYLRNPIPNGSTLIKRSALIEVGFYDEVFAEDCHMWTKLISKGDFVATGTYVYRWRMNPNGLTLSNSEKSAKKELEYVNLVWSRSKPAYISRYKIKEQSQRYVKNFKKSGNEFKKIFMIDLSRVSVHLIKHGHVKQGVFQLLAIASTGRIGLRIVFQRFHLVGQGYFNKIRNRAPFGIREIERN